MSEDGNSLIRSSDGSRVSGKILVVTIFRLADGKRVTPDQRSQGITADIVIFEGHEYTVSNVQPYTNYGLGFVQALCDLKPLTG